MRTRFKNLFSGTGESGIFCIVFAIVLLAFLVPYLAVLDTFIYSWRADLFAAILLFGFLAYCGFRRTALLEPGHAELKWIILPIAAFIIWSGASMFWAASFRAALHHTLVWSIYLIFYLVVRRLLESKGTYGALLTTAVAVLSLYATIAILGYFTLQIFGKGPALGIVYSKFGEQVNTILPLLLLALMSQRTRWFGFGIFAAGLLWMMIVASSTRAGIGLFIFGTLATCFYFLYARRSLLSGLRLAPIIGMLVVAPVFLLTVSYAVQDSENAVESRFSDAAHMQGSNDFRKLMLGISSEMIRENPILGVGADNFGSEVNRYRAKFAAANPDSAWLDQAESHIPERAHNEFAQIFAELGVVGILLFGWFLIGIGMTAYRAIAAGNKLTPHAVAAVIGIAIFLASSAVTSYSFRLTQNGLIFFFVLAVLSRIAFGEVRRTEEKSPAPSLLPVAAAAACAFMVAFSVVRVTSVAIARSANFERDTTASAVVYERAKLLDPENPDASYFYAMRLFDGGRHGEAVPHFQESIRLGKAPSTDFSYLATAQSLSGDNPGAERTLAEASVLYPRSTFVLTRYSVLLRQNGKSDLADAAWEKAVSIDAASANAWKALITKGAKAASDLAFQRDDHAKLMDLQPADAMYAVVSERDIRFPGERVKLPFERATDRLGSR